MPKSAKCTLLKLKKSTQKLSELCIKVTNIDGYLHGKFNTKEQHAQMQKHLGTKLHGCSDGFSYPFGKTLPILNKPCGSSCCFMLAISANSAALRILGIHWVFNWPMPCSAATVPPTSNTCSYTKAFMSASNW